MLFLLGVEHLHEERLRWRAAAHVLVEEVLLPACADQLQAWKHLVQLAKLVLHSSQPEEIALSTSGGTRHGATPAQASSSSQLQAARENVPMLDLNSLL